MKFILLTHQCELDKKNNTGLLVRELLEADCELVLWQRKSPDSKLLSLLETGQAALLFPNTELPEVGRNDVSTKDHITLLTCSKREDFSFTHFVIIDATWQQAKKMYRQSPYLQKAQKVSLEDPPPSSFIRRRNQRQGGLCTVECVIELLKNGGHGGLASTLEQRFSVFNQMGTANQTADDKTANPD